MKVKTSVFSLLTLLMTNAAFAGWQYDGYYIGDGYYRDDGSRFVISVRGGLSLANAKIKNELSGLEGYYWANLYTDQVISETAYDLAVDAGTIDAADWTDVGVGNLSKLSPKEKFSKTVFTAGASVGLSVPNHPQWRLEAGYDHIAETDYNQIPMYEGDLTLSSGSVVHVSSSGVSSTITTDVVSVMAFYDFFEGISKPINEVIPYVGFGVGYAMSKTTLKLTDTYGDLSTNDSLLEYGTRNNGVIQFDNPTDKNKYPTSDNIALLAGLGVSYGLSQYTFLDAGVRFMYIPKVSWDIANTDGTAHRTWFSAENMLYTDFLVGLRFEF